MKIESSIELLNELIEEYNDPDDVAAVGARMQQRLIALLIVEQRRTNELLGDLLSLARGRWR